MFHDKESIIGNANRYARWILYVNIANVVGMVFVDIFLLMMECCSCFSIIFSFLIYLGTFGVNLAMLAIYGGLYQSINKIDTDLIHWIIDNKCTSDMMNHSFEEMMFFHNKD